MACAGVSRLCTGRNTHIMTRFLDWLDESAAGLIRVAYLLAGVIAVASYFSDGNVPRAFSDFLVG